MKKIKLILVLLFITLFTISCNSDSNDDTSTGTETTNSVGEANIVLTAGGQEFILKGPCGWASAVGVNYIGANHGDNNLRTFYSYFNIKQLPTVTTTYTLVESSSDTDTSHITMNITEISGSVLTSWYSETSSGTLTLVVNDNKVTANLDGITLYPQTNSGFFTNGNTGAFANNGVLTGTLTFYR